MCSKLVAALFSHIEAYPASINAIRKNSHWLPENIKLSLITQIKERAKSQNAFLLQLRSEKSTKFVILEKRLGQQ